MYRYFAIAIAVAVSGCASVQAQTISLSAYDPGAVQEAVDAWQATPTLSYDAGRTEQLIARTVVVVTSGRKFERLCGELGPPHCVAGRECFLGCSRFIGKPRVVLTVKHQADRGLLRHETMHVLQHAHGMPIHHKREDIWCEGGALDRAGGRVHQSCKD